MKDQPMPSGMVGSFEIALLTRRGVMVLLVRGTHADVRADAPSHHRNKETLNQCWFNVGPSSATLAQHWNSIGSVSRACWPLGGPLSWVKTQICRHDDTCESTPVLKLKAILHERSYCQSFIFISVLLRSCLVSQGDLLRFRRSFFIL